jgi:hypothetical protein
MKGWRNPVEARSKQIGKSYFWPFAEKVLRHSPIPVFVIPCKKKLEHFRDRP